VRVIRLDPTWPGLRLPLERVRRLIKMVPYAPERGSALEAIKIAVDHGVVAAVGHTDGSYDQTHAAISAGAQTSTTPARVLGLGDTLHR
jgi:N-acetylglucosamine-6-phosphate deacetylase